MLIHRHPAPVLQPYVSSVWASEPRPDCTRVQLQREYMLPTGHMHVVFRLENVPVRIFDSPDDVQGSKLGAAVVGGARDSYYIKDASQPSATVGCVLKPGACLALFGVAAHELSGAHTHLKDLWGTAVAQIQMRLSQANSSQDRLAFFEQSLAARLSERYSLQPNWRHWLENFDANLPVSALVKASGLSHRHFNALFLNAVGLTPKCYARVQRMQQTIGRIQVAPQTKGIEIALDAGYSDQAHWSREFRMICGMTPGQYLERAPVQANHVPASADDRGQFSSRLGA